MDGLPGHLRPIRSLAEGGEKAVFLVEDVESGEQRVAAVLRDPRARQIERVHAVQALARHAESEGLVPILEVIESADACWLVSPYFERGDLGALLDARGGRPMPLVEALRLGERVARALARVHAERDGAGRAMVHGDVKPDNVLLDSKGQAHLTDFALATSSDLALGTIGYMAPELQTSADYTVATDVYALGCMLFELLTGTRPYRSDSGADELRRHVQEGVPSIRDRGLAPWNALDRLIERLLAKDPAERPSARIAMRSLGSLCALAGGTAGVVAEVVGREREQAAAQVAIDAAVNGAASVLTISGEAGTGKSLLLDRVVERCEGAGLVVLRSNAKEVGQLPFGTIIDLASQMAGVVESLSSEARAVLGALIAGGDREVDAPRPSSGEDAVLGALGEAIRSFSNGRGLVLALDDLQFCDPDSRGLLSRLADSVARGRGPQECLFFLSATRPGGEVVARDVESDVHADQLRLGSFDELEIRSLLRLRGIERPTARLQAFVADRSGGHPLFADWLIGRIQQSGGIEQKNSRDDLVSTPAVEDVPHHLGEAVLAIFEALDEDDRFWLERAACLGLRFSAAELASLTGKTISLSESLARSVESGLIVTARDGYQFRHALVWQALYNSIDRFRREQVHREIATWARAEAADGNEERIIVAAHHLLRAGAGIDTTELADWIRRAGRLAFERFAFLRAAEFFESVIDLLQDRDDPPEELIAKLHAEAGSAHYFAYDSTPAVRHLARAVDGLVDDVDRVRAMNDLVRVRSQSGFVELGSLNDMVPDLDRAARDIREREPRLAARCWLSIAEAYWAARRPSDTQRFTQRCVELAQSVGEDRICGEAYVLEGITWLERGDLFRALERLRTAIAYAERKEDRYVLRYARGRLALVLAAMGRFEEARRIQLACIESDDIVVNPGDASMSRALLACGSVLQGELERAETERERSLDLIARVDFPWPRLMINPCFAYVACLRGDYAEARALIREYAEPGVVFEDPSPMMPTVRRYLALIDAQAGDPVPLAADDLGADLLPTVGADERLDSLDLIGVALHVELCDAAGEIPDRRCKSFLRVAEERGSRVTMGWPFSIARSRGLFEFADGSYAEAREHFERDLDFSMARESRFEVARSRFDLARASSMLGGPLDLMRARDELELAMPDLSEAGPARFLAEADRFSRYLSRRAT